jgi:cytochrome c oxidase assembly protein subunit 15
MSISASKKRFQFFNLTAIVLLFILILAGAALCAAQDQAWDAPIGLSASAAIFHLSMHAQLPADYKQKYVEGRMKKNERFAKTLDVFGYSDLATRIREDRSILVPEDFNAGKTWTEYVNRLIGALSGIPVVGCNILVCL